MYPWLKEAQDLRAKGSSGEMLRNNSTRKVSHHTTEAPSGRTSSGNTYFELMHRVLTDKKAEPHFLVDPLTDEVGQYFPVDRSARALKNGAGISVNKDGTVNVQVEWVAYAGKPFTRYWKPGPNIRALMRFLADHGIPDEWPAGVLPASAGSSRRSVAVWRRSGHFGHRNAPGNTHWDPGAIDQDALLAIKGPTAASIIESEEDDDMTPDQAERQARIENKLDTLLGKHEATSVVVTDARNHALTIRKDVVLEDGLTRRILRNIETQGGRNTTLLAQVLETRVTREQVAGVLRAVEGVPDATVDEASGRLVDFLRGLLPGDVAEPLPPVPADEPEVTA